MTRTWARVRPRSTTGSRRLLAPRKLRNVARRGVLDEIERLDPEKDFQRICYLSTNYDFPWDVEQSLSLAFFKTYGIPTISELLDHTGEFRDEPRNAMTTPSWSWPRCSITGWTASEGVRQ